MIFPELLLATLFLSAQQKPNAPAPQFEVAVIKPNKQDPRSVRFVGGSCHGIDKQYAPSEMAPPPLGRCVYVHAPVQFLITAAFKATVTGGPAWVSDLNGSPYDFEAKAEDEQHTTEAELFQMLQRFLVDQLKLQFHLEQRQVPAFNLVIARGGLKIKESVGEGPERVSFGQEGVTVQHATMTRFANSIGGMLKGRVIDKTGLSGTYDFTLKMEDDFAPDAFIAALHAQIGVDVESFKTPTDFLIIDHIEKPADGKAN